MALKSDDVRNIAQLARLHLDDDEIGRYAADLSSILDLVEQMQRVDTSAVEPLANPLDAEQRLRDDAVTETDERDKFQAIAPDVADGFYRVPKVIE